MPKARKTIDISFVLDRANTALRQPTLNEDERKAICTLLEGILIEANAYRGFRYIDGWETAEKTGEVFRRQYIPVAPGQRTSV